MGISTKCPGRCALWVTPLGYRSNGGIDGLCRLRRTLRFKGIRVNDPEDIDAALDEAFAADRPVVLNLKADPNTPPLPAHISMDQATGLAKSLITGDPATGRVISQSLRAGAARLFERFGTSSDD